MSPTPQSQGHLSSAHTAAAANFAANFPPLPERNRGSGHTQRPPIDQCSAPPTSTGESMPEAPRLTVEGQHIDSKPLYHPPLGRRVPPYLHRPISHPYPIMMNGHYAGPGYHFPFTPYPFPQSHFTQHQPFPQLPYDLNTQF